MKNIIKIQLTLMILFLIGTTSARADMLIRSSGEPINCHINYIMGGVILAKTQDGENRFLRNTDHYKARDFVEVGFLKRKRIIGQINFLDNDSMDIRTKDGKLTIKRYKIRNIILTQD